jgi:hypothetical protein
MSFIVVTRNPRNKKLIAINDEADDVAEFEDSDQAVAAAVNTTACMAWGYEILEVTKP